MGAETNAHTSVKNNWLRRRRLQTNAANLKILRPSRNTELEKSKKNFKRIIKQIARR